MEDQVLLLSAPQFCQKNAMAAGKSNYHLILISINTGQVANGTLLEYTMAHSMNVKVKM